MNRVAALSAVIAVVLLAVGVQSAAAPDEAPDSRYVGGVADHGTRAELLSLQRAVPGVMTDWIAGGRVNGRVGERDQLGMILSSLGEEAVTARRVLLTEVLTERLVEPEVGRFGDQFWFALYRTQPSTIYVGNRFEVAEWEGSQVFGDVARVLVLARQHYTFPNGTEGAEPWLRYLLVFERAPQARYGWLLIEHSASPAPRAGSESVADR